MSISAAVASAVQEREKEQQKKKEKSDDWNVCHAIVNSRLSELEIAKRTNTSLDFVHEKKEQLKREGYDI